MTEEDFLDDLIERLDEYESKRDASAGDLNSLQYYTGYCDALEWVLRELED